MTNIIDIGLPDISGETIERLAEECEFQISHYLLERVPEKSIEDLFISCTLSLLDGQLDVDISIEIGQAFDTGQSLDDLIQEAIDWGAEWLEKQLMELKNK
ncbi:MAG: DUF3194 domain-containing protein [Candidatus Thorarchaeota archaeon]